MSCVFQMTALQEKDAASAQDNATDDELELQEKLDYFPDDYNQLDLLETHRHLIPTGTQSLWPGESEDDDEEKSEDWYQTQEENLKENPKELILFAAENNRVSLYSGKERSNYVRIFGPLPGIVTWSKCYRSRISQSAPRHTFPLQRPLQEKCSITWRTLK